jgi:superfamily II RNA helicase
MFDTQVEPAVIRDMVQGAPDPLTSAFRLRHSQLLALAATEGASAEAMLQVGSANIWGGEPTCFSSLVERTAW